VFLKEEPNMLKYWLRNPLLVIALCIGVASQALAVDQTLLKVDINTNDARSATLSGWTAWLVTNSGTNGVISNTFANGVKVSFMSPWYATENTTLEPFFAPYYGALCGDMIRVTNSPSVNRGDIRCTISNLSPGSYTLKSYHNPPAYSPTLNNLMDVNDHVGTDPWVKEIDNFNQPILIPNDATVMANPVVLNFVIPQPGLDYQADYITRDNPTTLTDPNIPAWSRNVGICGFELISHAIYAAYDPSPLPDSTIRYNTSYNLQWMTPDPYEAGTQYYDLYFTTDSTALANGATPAGALLVSHTVQSGAMSSACPALVASTNYYWRVDTYGMKNGVEYKTVGAVWHFDTNNQAPVVDLGPNQVTKQGRTVTLTGVATDLDALPLGSSITYKWEVRNDPNTDPNYAGNYPSGSPFPATTASVSFVLDPNDAHLGTGRTFTYRCTVSDGNKSSYKEILVACYSRSMSNCDVNKKLANYQTAIRSAGDYNDDCVTDLKDMAIYVNQWLACKAVNNVCQ
jgi:hypothetical protein